METTTEGKLAEVQRKLVKLGAISLAQGISCPFSRFDLTCSKRLDVVYIFETHL